MKQDEQLAVLPVAGFRIATSTSWPERHALPPTATGVLKMICVGRTWMTEASTRCAPQAAPVMKTCIGNWKFAPKIVARVDWSFGPVRGDTE